MYEGIAFFYNKLLLLPKYIYTYTHKYSLVCAFGNEKGNSFIPLSGFILIPSVERFNGFILMCYEYVYCEMYFIFYGFFCRCCWCCCCCVCVYVDICRMDEDEWSFFFRMRYTFWVAWTILLILFVDLCVFLFSSLSMLNLTRCMMWIE